MPRPICDQISEIRSDLASSYVHAPFRDRLQIVRLAIDSQDIKTGAFGSRDDGRTQHCTTAQMLDAMLRLDQGSHDVDGEITGSLEKGIQKSVQWLTSSTNSDGTWGEDLWDTCEAIVALLDSGVQSDDPLISRAVKRLRREVDSTWQNSSGFWAGPGFLGQSLVVFNAIRDSSYAATVAAQLFELQNVDTGAFDGTIGGKPQLDAPIEWHTACAILGLYSSGTMPEQPLRTQRAVDWLKGQQNADHSWGPAHHQITCFATRQSVLALVEAEGRSSEQVQSAITWFEEQADDERCPLMTILVGATCIVRTNPNQLYGSIPYVTLRRYDDILAELQTELDSVSVELQSQQKQNVELQLELRSANDSAAPLRQEISDLKNQVQRLEIETDRLRSESQVLRARLDSYAVRLTNNALAVLSFIAAIVAIVLTVIIAS